MNRVRKKLNRLLNDRRGTAEIVGSVMFLLIMMFFFTNVFLWHDRVTQEMDGVLSDRMNSQISANWVSTTENEGLLNVTNNGGTEVALSRLWITSGEEHFYAELENQSIWVAAGATVTIEVGGPPGYEGQRPLEVNGSGQNVTVVYDAALAESFKILTVRGNTAACSYTSFASLTGNITIILVGVGPDDEYQIFVFRIGTDSYSLSYNDASDTVPKDPGEYVITAVPPGEWTLVGIIGTSTFSLSEKTATVVVGAGQSCSVAFVYERPAPTPTPSP